LNRLDRSSLPKRTAVMRLATIQLLLIAAFLAAMEPPAAAQFVTCPAANAGRRCQVDSPNATLVVFAASGQGPVLEVESWVVDGVEQIGVEGIRVRDDSAGNFPSFLLFSAQTVSSTSQILIVHEDDDLVLSSIFTLRENEADTTMDIDVTTRLLSGSASGRVFLVSDPNLDGDANDDSVVASESGLPVVQKRGRFEATQTLEQGTAPTGFDVGLASEFAPLLSNQLVTLDGTQSQSGPADLGSVLVWQATLGSEDLQFRVRRSLALPEASLSQSTAAVLLTLLAVARVARSRHRRRTQTR
jgi:hypothetical protein